MESSHWGGGGAYKLQPFPPPSNIEIKKQTHSFVDMMLSNVLCDLPFSQTQPLNLADD